MRSRLLLVCAWLCLGLPMTAAAAGPDGAGPESVADSRLVLQLGMLLAVVYVAFVCAWLSMTRRRRDAGQTRRRVGSRRVRARSASRRASAARRVAASPWTCEIVWKRGTVWSRFQAVMLTSDDRRRRVVTESAGLRWPPKDVRNPPTRELEDKLEGLVASIIATGWEPVASSGAWSERRFVWRRPGEPPTRLRPGRRRSTGPPAVPSRRGAAGSRVPARRPVPGLDKGGSARAS